MYVEHWPQKFTRSAQHAACSMLLAVFDHQLALGATVQQHGVAFSSDNAMPRGLKILEYWCGGSGCWVCDCSCDV
jgi:hypothetical protein